MKYNLLSDIKYEKKSPTKLTYISKKQLQEIINNTKPNALQKLGRGTFIFLRFCDLAYVDVRNLYPHHIGTVVP